MFRTYCEEVLVEIAMTTVQKVETASSQNADPIKKNIDMCYLSNLILFMVISLQTKYIFTNIICVYNIKHT